MEDTTELPRPSWFQMILAVLVIGLGTGLVSLVSLFIADEPQAWTLVFFIMVPALVLLITQYRGMFRYRIGSTLIVLSMLSIAFVFACAFSFASIQWLEQVPHPFYLLPFLGIWMLNLGIGLAVRANWLWYRQLKTAQEQGTLPTRQHRFTLLEMMVATLLLAVMFGPASYRLGAEMPIYQEHAAADQAPFPISEAAQNVTYRQESFGTIRAVWQESPASLERWLDTQSERSDVYRFIRTKTPEQDVLVQVPQPPSIFGARCVDKQLPRGSMAWWRYNGRKVYLAWEAETQSGLTTVYYIETQRF